MPPIFPKGWDKRLKQIENFASELRRAIRKHAANSRKNKSGRKKSGRKKRPVR
jgi:hypothetical protein